MNILIIGAGNTGRNLAARFCDERHDIVVVDRQTHVLAELSSQYDLLTCPGDGSNPRVLEEAGIRKMDMVIAVTDSDETNILACACAKKAGVVHRIARVSNPERMRSRLLDLGDLGVTLAINQKEECARELFNILRLPGALEVVDMLDGHILAVGLMVHMDSPLIQAPLKTLASEEWASHIRFIGALRGTDLLVPRGDTQFMIGDELYFVGTAEDIARFIKWAWPEHSRFEKVIIAGGGDLGVQLAQLMEPVGIPLVLIECDEDRATYCSGLLHRTLVIKGSALDQETIKNVGVVDRTAFVAVTGNDENNMIACLVAAKMGANFTAAEVNKPEYVPIISSASLLDHAVNPHLSLINAILHFVRGKNVRDAVTLHRLPGELLEFVVSEKSRWCDKAIKDLRIPAAATIAAVAHGREIRVAVGDLKLQAGDRVVIFSHPTAVSKLTALFQK